MSSQKTKERRAMMLKNLSIQTPHGIVRITDVRSLTLRPGDVVIVRIPREHYKRDQLANISRNMKQLFPKNKVAITPDDIHITKTTQEASDESRRQGRGNLDEADGRLINQGFVGVAEG